MIAKSLKQYNYNVYDIFMLCLNALKFRAYSLTKKSLPIYLNFAVTYDCNSRCMTCGIWQKNKNNSGSLEKMLSTEEIRVFFSNKKFIKNVLEVNITGGEPFLRNDIVDIIRIIADSTPKARISMVNNGLIPSILEDKLKAILEITDHVHVGISIDGIGEMHDKIRGINGAFERAIQTLDKITQLKMEYPKLGITIGMTITSLNYNQILQVHELAKQYNTNFTFRTMQYSDFYFSNTQQINDLRITKEEISIIEKQIKSLPYDINLFFLEGVTKYVYNPKRQYFSCYSGLSSCFIDPYGNVYPCQFMNMKFGNIRN